MAHRFFLGVVAAVVTLAATHGAFAQTAWEQYRQQLERNREAQARRWEQWREEQQKIYEQRRAAQAAETPFRIDLRDRSIPSGEYVINLPFGLQARVNVRPEDATAPPAWSGAYLGQIVALGRRIHDDLRDIRYGVYQTNHDHLKQQADEALSGIAEVQRLALERADPAQIRQEFQDFDQHWHRLAHDLADQNYLNAGWIQREAAAITQNDQVLHQILRIGEARVYDRLQVAALTRQLTDATEHLLEDVELESRNNPHLAVIRRRAERVHRLASDLEQAVVQDAPFSTILDEYEQFDQAWHRLLASARDLPDVSRHLAQAGRRVRGIDVELHRELRVSPPTLPDPVRIRNLSESVARQAEHLAGDLRQAIRDDNHDLVRMAEDFAWSAENLHRSLSDSQPNETDAAQLAQRYWDALYGRLSQRERERLEHSVEIASALDQDLRRLLAMIAERR